MVLNNKIGSWLWTIKRKESTDMTKTVWNKAMEKNCVHFGIIYQAYISYMGWLYFLSKDEIISLERDAEIIN